VNADRMWAALEGGFSQATDLAEYVMQACDVDYRTAYQVVGIAVRRAGREGLRGLDLDGGMLDAAAVEFRGEPLGLAGKDLTEVLDPRAVVETRTAPGGAAPPVVERMARDCERQAERQRSLTRARRAAVRDAEERLVARATAVAAGDAAAGAAGGEPDGP